MTSTLDVREQVARLLRPNAFNIDPPRQKDSEHKAVARESAYALADAILALISPPAGFKELRTFAELVRDQPDTHPTMGGRWIDWAKGRARHALAAVPMPEEGEI